MLYEVITQVVVNVGERQGNDAHVLTGLKAGDIGGTSCPVRLS